jgi:hypothetical protein
LEDIELRPTDEKKRREGYDDERPLKGTGTRWFGEVGRRLMHLVPAPAVRLMKRRVQSRPG